MVVCFLSTKLLCGTCWTCMCYYGGVCRARISRATMADEDTVL